MRREKLFTFLAAGLCAGVISLAAPGVAMASEQDFLYDLQNNGNITGPTSVLLDLGHRACTEHQQGVPAQQSIDNIYGATQLGSRSDAQFMYESALIYLC